MTTVTHHNGCTPCSGDSLLAKAQQWIPHPALNPDDVQAGGRIAGIAQAQDGSEAFASEDGISSSSDDEVWNLTHTCNVSGNTASYLTESKLTSEQCPQILIY